MFFASLALACAAAASCADSEESPRTTEPREGGTPPTLADAARDDDGGATRNAGVLRIANLAPGLGAVDFCYQALGTGTLVGPVLGRGGVDAGAAADAADAGDAAEVDAAADAADAGPEPEAGSPSVPYLAVSRYVTVDATGTLTLSFVSPGASSCRAPLVTGAVTVDPGKLVTVALMGRADVDAGPDSLGVSAFVDNRETMRDVARVRLVHAALGTPAKPSLGALAARAVAGRSTPLASQILPRRTGDVSTEIPVDALGYASIAPMPAPTAIEISANGDAGAASIWLSPFTDFGLTGGSLHTGFVSSDGPGGAALLWCDDTSTSVTLGACKLLR